LSPEGVQRLCIGLAPRKRARTLFDQVQPDRRQPALEVAVRCNLPDGSARGRREDRESAVQSILMPVAEGPRPDGSKGERSEPEARSVSGTPRTVKVQAA